MLLEFEENKSQILHQTQILAQKDEKIENLLKIIGHLKGNSLISTEKTLLQSQSLVLAESVNLKSATFMN